jgi:hypothetical protein
LSKVRTAPSGNNLFSVSSGLRTVFQVCGSALYCLFSAEELYGETPDEKAAELLFWYELLVQPLAIPRGQQDINISIPQDNYVNGLPPNLHRIGEIPYVGADGTAYIRTLPNSAATVNGSTPSPRVSVPVLSRQELNKGKTWNFDSHREREPKDSDFEGVLRYFTTRNKKVLELSISDLARKRDDCLDKYNEALRKLNTYNSQLITAQAALEGAREQYLRTTSTLSEEELMALTESVKFFYEKVWVAGNKVFAITKPIIATYRKPDHDDISFVTEELDRSKMRVLLGNFTISIDDNGHVDYKRTDGRFALRESRGDRRDHPHKMGDRICWGVYQELLKTCHEKGEFAQLLILTYQHLCSVTYSDNYIPLETYASCLDLRITFDPEENLLEPPKEVKSLEDSLRESATEGEELNIPVPTPQVAIPRVEHQQRINPIQPSLPQVIVPRTILHSGIEEVTDDTDSVTEELNRQFGNIPQVSEEALNAISDSVWEDQEVITTQPNPRSTTLTASDLDRYIEGIEETIQVNIHPDHQESELTDI